VSGWLAAHDRWLGRRRPRWLHAATTKTATAARTTTTTANGGGDLDHGRLADQVPLVLLMIVYTMIGVYLLVIR